MRKKKIMLLFTMLLLGANLFAQKTAPVAGKNLPKSAQDYIAKKYEGFTINKSEKGLSENKLTIYKATVSKGKDKFLLTFDSKGKLIKNTDTNNQPPPVSDNSGITKPEDEPAAQPASAK